MSSFNVTRAVIFLKVYKRVACEKREMMYVCVCVCVQDLHARQLKRDIQTLLYRVLTAIRFVINNLRLRI